MPNTTPLRTGRIRELAKKIRRFERVARLDETRGSQDPETAERIHDEYVTARADLWNALFVLDRNITELVTLTREAL